MDMLKWTEMKGTGPNKHEAFIIEWNWTEISSCLFKSEPALWLLPERWADRMMISDRLNHHIFIHLISTENIQFKIQAEAEGLSALTTSERA